MNHAEQTLTLVCQAQARVQRAAHFWQSANLARIDDCHGALEAAAADLRAVEAILQSCSASQLRALRPLTQAIKSALLAMKQDIKRLDKVVGASSAFLRGVARVTGPAAPVYGADGHIQRDPAQLACQGAEG
jgi:hypothetical protein